MPWGRINAENAAAVVEEDCAPHTVCACTGAQYTIQAHSCPPLHGTHYPQPDAHKTEVLSTTVVNSWYVVQVQGRAREGTAR